jgi:L-alanine-DL-glutamate epimerase-like enolase superfamily enzyme
MKLANCTAYVVKTPAPHRGGRILTFLKLETDEGITGWGETACQHTFYSNYKIFPALINMLFETYLKGEDALAREKCLKRMYMGFSSSHPDFVNASLFSAFDIAMWDIAGKACKKPVYELLGGKYRDKVRTYTYIFGSKNDEWESRWLDPLKTAEDAEYWIGIGHNALKYDPLPQINASYYPPTPWELSNESLERAEASLSCLRGKVGTNIDILIGTHGQLTTASARRFGKMIEKYNVMWFEEPIPPENTREMGRLAGLIDVPIATGERLAHIYDFERLFTDNGCAIAQPDVASVGGITETKKIAAMAEPKYIQVAPHVWGGPISLASALQIDTSISNFLIQECIDQGGGFFDELIDEPFVWENGYLYPINRPGLGVNLVESALEQYSVL